VFILVTEVLPGLAVQLPTVLPAEGLQETCTAAVVLLLLPVVPPATPPALLPPRDLLMIAAAICSTCELASHAVAANAEKGLLLLGLPVSAAAAAAAAAAPALRLKGFRLQRGPLF
jgi:hypothetical protein